MQIFLFFFCIFREKSVSLYRKIEKSMNLLVQNTAKLLSANVLAQLVGLMIYPVLTRLYSPEDFGALNVFLSLGAILVLVSTAELQYAIVLPREDAKAWRLLQCGIVMVGVTAVCCLWQPALALYVLVTGVWTLVNYWYTRCGQFGAISRYQMGQSFGAAAMKTGLGYVPVGGGLIWGTVLAPIVSLVSNWWYAGRRVIGDRWRTPFCRREMVEALSEYRNFPCYNLPRSLVGNLGHNLPSLLLAPAFGLYELGFFGMAITLAFRPINMISSSIYQVLYQQFAERVNSGRSVRSVYRTYVVRAAAVSVPVFAALWFVLPDLCGMLLGAGWEVSGEYIRWMLPWLVCSLLVAPICCLCDVFGEQKKGFLFEILLSLARLGGIGVGLVTRRIDYAVIGYSMGNAVVMALQLVWYTALVARYEESLR